MTAAKRAPRPTADDLTFAEATPPHREPDPAPADAKTAVPAVSDTPESASKLASSFGQNGHVAGGMNIPLAALLAPRVEPEMDLVALNVRVPRYVAEALRVAALLSRGRSGQQGIAAEALKRHLPPELLDEAYRAAAGGADRP